MRNIFLILIVSAMIGFGCADDSATTRNLVFHVQSAFEDDMVEIYVDDGTLVLSQEVTTNHLLGVDVNAIKTIEVTTGSHSIRVVVNGANELRTTVSLNSDLYIGVRYDRETGELSIQQSLEPYLYD
jgi:hypothetical protein